MANPAGPSRSPTPSKLLADPKTLAMAIAEAAWAKNAYQTSILDVSRTASFTDIFIILTGRSDRHVAAITSSIEKEMKDKGILPVGVEGRLSGTWVLLDFGDVVVHLFEKQAREFYELERLWGDATAIPVTQPKWVIDFERMEAEGELY